MVIDDVVKGWGGDLEFFREAFCQHLVIHQRIGGARVGWHDVFCIATVHAEDAVFPEVVDRREDHDGLLNARKRRSSESRYPV